MTDLFTAWLTDVAKLKMVLLARVQVRRGCEIVCHEVRVVNKAESVTPVLCCSLILKYKRFLLPDAVTSQTNLHSATPVCRPKELSLCEPLGRNKRI